MVPTRRELKTLAHLGLRESEALYDARLYDGAAYLAGYVVELALKARICKLLGIQDYPAVGPLRQVYAVHDLDQLVFLAGLKPKLDLASPAVVANWSLARPWNPERRYTGGTHGSHALGILTNSGSEERDTPVDREILVKGIRRVGRELHREYGPVALLLLIAPESAIGDDWHVVVSAKGLNRISRAEAIPRIIDLLRRVLSRELWPAIKRVSVLPTDDPFVSEMTFEFPTKKEIIRLHSCQVAGYDISKGLVVTSRRVAA